MKKSFEINDADNKNLAWIKITKALSQGDFTQIPYLIEKDLTYLKYMHLIGRNEENYKQMLEGICGVLSVKFPPIDIK